MQGKYPSAIGLFRYGYKMIKESRQLKSDRRVALRGTSMQSETELEGVIHAVEVYFHRLGVQILVVSCKPRHIRPVPPRQITN
jgi:hypothetical protein